jgi:hypothetical protein
MNCPQCQTVNGPDAAFCGNCGTRLAAAGAQAGPGGQAPATGTPLGDNPGTAPTGYAPAGDYSAPPGYAAPGGSSYPPPAYGPVGSQAPGGYPQGQYPQPAPGAYPQPASSSGLPPVNVNLNRLTTVDKIVAGATLITMISIWLPWYAFSFGGIYGLGSGNMSFSGTWGHGWLWIEFVVALVLLAYLAARAAWERLPFTMPVAHAPLLVVGTALQLLLIVIAFFDIPYGNDGMGWSWAAFIGLIAALAAAGPVVYPAVRSYLDNRRAAGPRAY